MGATAVAPLPHPAAGSAPLSAIDPVPAHRPSAPAEDINTMSVDSFLDSIIASTTKPAAISVVPESTPSTHDDQQQAPQAPQVPQFRPPPVATPVLLPSAPLTGTLSGVAPELKAHIIVTEPEDATQRALIDLVAKYVATDGEAFEKVILLFNIYFYIFVLR